MLEVNPAASGNDVCGVFNDRHLKVRVEWLCLVVHGRGLKMRIWEAVSAFLSLSFSSLELVSMVRSGCENLDV